VDTTSFLTRLKAVIQSAGASLKHQPRYLTSLKTDIQSNGIFLWLWEYGLDESARGGGGGHFIMREQARMSKVG